MTPSNPADANCTVPVPRGGSPTNYGPGLPQMVLLARMRLGPGATPEQVADEVRASGCGGATVEDVRHLWDEGHFPTESSAPAPPTLS